MEAKDYINYILECRKRGFRDDAIKKSLVDKGWPEREVVKAFSLVTDEKLRTKEVGEDVDDEEEIDEEEKETNTEEKIKKEVKEHKQISKDIEDEALDGEVNLRDSNSIMLFLDEELRNALEKRAKKNMLTLPEQIEDILRRSTLNQKIKRTGPEEKLDDPLVGLFSRKNTGPKSKNKKKAKKKSGIRRLIRKS